MRRFLAFDVETAKIVPAGIRDLLAHRPLGIACAAAVAADSQEPKLWHGRDAAGAPAGQMTREEAIGLVIDLAAFVERGYTIVTWNGLGFDFDVLAEESGQADACRSLAEHHVDMLFHILCIKGFLVSLQKAADGMKLPGKTQGVSGAVAPEMWAAGRHDEVLAYCAQDVRLTLQLAQSCERLGRLAWITQRGTTSTLPLPNGWLTVREARRLPLPDTSWMSDPPKRGRFLKWLTGPGSA